MDDRCKPAKVQALQEAAFNNRESSFVKRSAASPGGQGSQGFAS